MRLSPKEYELLARLVEGDGRVLTHRELLIAIWGPAHAEDLPLPAGAGRPAAAEVEAEPSAPKLILTEPGVGYRFMR